MSAAAEAAVAVASRKKGAPPRISPARVVGAFVIGAWAALFWFILISGRTPFFLGVRTRWVIPLGALILTAAALGRLASLRSQHPQPISARDARAAAIVLFPVVVILALPPAALGSYAAGRRSSAARGGTFAGAATVPRTGDLSMVDVGSSLVNRDVMKSLVARAGSIVRLTGFVSRRPGDPATELILNRFVISCCVADALGIQVRVAGAPPGRFEPDDWVRVTGKIYPLGREVIVSASRIEPVPRPKHPYLSP